MDKNSYNNSIFILIGLFLLAIIVILWLAQALYWLIISIRNKRQPKQTQYYQSLLKKYQYDCEVKEVKFVTNFCNYNSKNKVLKLNHRDYQEKTTWNLYRNLIHVLLIKWKKDNRKTALSLVLTIISFYLSASLIITCALIYYINLWVGSLDSIDSVTLSIFSFIGLLSLVLTWLTWTMIFEKVRKEVLHLAQDLDVRTLRTLRSIVAHKTIFPGSELLF